MYKGCLYSVRNSLLWKDVGSDVSQPCLSILWMRVQKVYICSITLNQTLFISPPLPNIAERFKQISIVKKIYTFINLSAKNIFLYKPLADIGEIFNL